MRKDYLLDRWVVIAAQRKKRPTDFAKAKEEKKPLVCPFCPGNEHMTPPAILVYLKANGGMIKDMDQGDCRHKKWLLRCIPNLYPAFAPSNNKETNLDTSGYLESMDAQGHHEVIIESPNHGEHPSVARISQIIQIINAYQDRFEALSSREYVKYVSIFRNHGADAGASLSHAHTQIIATPIVPKIVQEELKASKKFWNTEKRCVFCDMIEEEKAGSRLIFENERFIAFAPWASVHPYEFWIIPKAHQPTILDMSADDVSSLAQTFRACFGGLSILIDDPPYNFGFHMAPNEYYHWHLEVYPRLTIWAGFEKSTSMFINTVSPEQAATSLREAILKEFRNLI